MASEGVRPEAAGALDRILSGFNVNKMLRYAGGDWFLSDILIALLMRAPCRRCVLVEAFGGSGVVSQYAPRGKFPVVVYNDADRLLATLHRFVKENPQVLREVLALIPYSRHVYEYVVGRLEEAREVCELVAASFIFYALNASYSGIIGGSFSTVKSVTASGARAYAGRINGILEAARRFRDVTIENLDFRECISKYDGQETVFYLDPPYVGKDYYRLGFGVADARDLVEILNSAKGYYLLKLHEDQLRYYGGLRCTWRRVVEKPAYMGYAEDEDRGVWRVVLLTNYDPGKGLSGTGT